jgi:hypothetical protein
MSGTRSRKYPVCGWPFKRTPTSRRRSTHRQTVERETPISFAIRAPLIAIVALSAKSVSKEASRRSVVPGREVGAMNVAVAYLSSMESTSKLRFAAGAEWVSVPDDRKSAPVSA